MRQLLVTTGLCVLVFAEFVAAADLRPAAPPAPRPFQVSVDLKPSTLPVASSQPAPPTTAPNRVLSMEDAVRLALERNQTLRASRLNVDEAKADETTASLKPNPVFTTSSTGFPIFSPSQLTLSNLNTDVTYAQSLSYLFERGGKRAKRTTVAEDTTLVTGQTVADAERQLAFQTRQAFINVLLAKSVLDLARANLKDFSQVVDINRQRMTAGDLAEGDFYKISLQKLQFEQDVSAGEVGLVQARAALRQVVGYETVPDDFEVVGDLAYTKYAFTLDDLKRQALATRPDLQAAQTGVKLAEDTQALAYGNRARDVTGQVEYDRAASSNTVGIGVSFDLPIHDRNQGNIARSRIAVHQASETEAATRFAVLTDVVNAYAAFTTNEQIVSLFQSGYLDQARQSLDITRYMYQRGAGSLLDLLDAERTYRTTELAFRQAVAAYMTSVQQLTFVVGRQVIP